MCKKTDSCLSSLTQPYVPNARHGVLTDDDVVAFGVHKIQTSSIYRVRMHGICLCLLPQGTVTTSPITVNFRVSFVRRPTGKT